MTKSDKDKKPVVPPEKEVTNEAIPAKEEKSEEFSNFEAFAKKLLKVPKKDIKD
jgi:hypothetical protein